MAKEIEGLLSKTTFEERLKWVLDQLKDLKEETNTIQNNNSVDILTEMESVINVFDDSLKTLSKEDRLSIDTIIKNYIHSLLNRELIEEYDG